MFPIDRIRQRNWCLKVKKGIWNGRRCIKPSSRRRVIRKMPATPPVNCRRQIQQAQAYYNRAREIFEKNQKIVNQNRKILTENKKIVTENQRILQENKKILNQFKTLLNMYGLKAL